METTLLPMPAGPWPGASAPRAPGPDTGRAGAFAALLREPGGPSSVAPTGGANAADALGGDGSALASQLDPPPSEEAELREAFDDFVGQTLFGQLMAQMRKSIAENPYFGGGPGQAAFQSQLDQVLVEKVADASGGSVSAAMWKSFSRSSS